MTWQAVIYIESIYVKSSLFSPRGKMPPCLSRSKVKLKSLGLSSPVLSCPETSDCWSTEIGAMVSCVQPDSHPLKGIFVPFSWGREAALQWGYSVLFCLLGCHRIKNSGSIRADLHWSCHSLLPLAHLLPILSPPPHAPNASSLPPHMRPLTSLLPDVLCDHQVVKHQFHWS